MIRTLRKVVSGLLLSVIALLVGCQRGPTLVPVQGKVVYQGRPVSAGSIYFQPDSAGGDAPQMASSLLQEDGSFTLRTYPHGNGAMVGSYRVTVSLGFGATPQLAKYTRVKDTPLKIDVPPEGRTDLVFTLE